MRVTINDCALKKLAVFEKSGHSPQIEERELFLSTMRDFLDSAVPAA